MIDSEPVPVPCPCPGVVSTHSPGWSCSPSWSCWPRWPRCSTPGYSAPRWRPPAGWSAPGGRISGCRGHLPARRGWARTPRCPHLEQHRVSTHRCLPCRPDPVRSPRPRAGSRGRPRSGRARRSSTRRMAAGTRFTCVRDVIIAINIGDVHRGGGGLEEEPGGLLQHGAQSCCVLCHDVQQTGHQQGQVSIYTWLMS